MADTHGINLHICMYSTVSVYSTSIVIDDCFKKTEEERKETVRKGLEPSVLSDKKKNPLA